MPSRAINTCVLACCHSVGVQLGHLCLCKNTDKYHNHDANTCAMRQLGEMHGNPAACGHTHGIPHCWPSHMAYYLLHSTRRGCLCHEHACAVGHPAHLCRIPCFRGSGRCTCHRVRSLHNLQAEPACTRVKAVKAAIDCFHDTSCPSMCFDSLSDQHACYILPHNSAQPHAHPYLQSSCMRIGCLPVATLVPWTQMTMVITISAKRFLTITNDLLCSLLILYCYCVPHNV